MIFSTFEYLLFLPLVVLLYWCLKGTWRLWLVIASSFFFYMSWLPGYGLLLLLLTTANWLLGICLGKTAKTNAVLARTFLWAGLILNLGALCYYKYTGFILDNVAKGFNFFQGNFVPVAHRLPVWDAPVVEILLPLGISFFVFEFVHYLVDVYKGHAPVTSWGEFAAFASFFPSQIAGPIKRYQDFIERLHAPERLSPSLFYEATGLIMQGLFKKIAIADPLGMVIYPTFAATAVGSTADVLIASIGFVIQVYCDFSGYTDIGRGSALLMGIRLPVNFELPYMAADLTEFWRRWHISLSSWLRDYIYIPLGGSRYGVLMTWRNLFITMAACGLWHGASWHYVIFGCLQGVGLIVHRQWQNLADKSDTITRFGKTFVGQWWGVFLTMTFMTGVLIVFRAPDMPHAMLIFQGLLNVAAPCQLYVPLLKSGALVFLGTYLLFWRAQVWWQAQASKPARTLAIDSSTAAGTAPAIASPATAVPSSATAIASDATASPHNATGTTSHATAVPSNASKLADNVIALPLRLASWTAAVLLMIAATPNEAVPFVYFQF